MKENKKLIYCECAGYEVLAYSRDEMCKGCSAYKPSGIIRYEIKDEEGNVEIIEEEEEGECML